MIDRDDLRMIVTERFGHEWDGSEDDLDAILALDVEPPARRWEGEARAAFDQALGNASKDATFGDPGFWLQRAQIAATLAGVEQARLANLIAWKQLQATRLASADQGIGLLPLGGSDAIADEIEQGLGIA